MLYDPALREFPTILNAMVSRALVFNLIDGRFCSYGHCAYFLSIATPYPLLVLHLIIEPAPFQRLTQA